MSRTCLTSSISSGRVVADVASVFALWTFFLTARKCLSSHMMRVLTQIAVVPLDTVFSALRVYAISGRNSVLSAAVFLFGLTPVATNIVSSLQVVEMFWT